MCGGGGEGSGEGGECLLMYSYVTSIFLSISQMGPLPLYTTLREVGSN